jgi:hypothetical protein
MAMRIIKFVMLLIMIVVFVLALTAPALAYSPLFPEGNHNPANAYRINNPAKSWAIYTTLDHPDKGDYYKFMVSKGDKIEIALMASDNPSMSGFLPSFALMVPGLGQRDSVPSYIEVPSGYGTIVVNGTNPGKASYEPFSPGWLYELADLTTNAPANGTYYIAVYDNAHKTGNYGLAIGYLEEWTPVELVLLPYNVHSIYVWEGQDRFITFLPIILVLIAGGGIFYWRGRQDRAPKGMSKWLASFACLAFLGSAVSTIYQMLLAVGYTGVKVEVIMTLLVAIISIVLGVLTLLYAVRDKPALTLWRRVALVAIGLIALFLWSGLYFGPALAILAAFMPPYATKKMMEVKGQVKDQI